MEDKMEYTVTLTDRVRPGQAEVVARVPDGPTMVFSRPKKNLTVKVFLTPTQARKLYGFDVKPAVKPKPASESAAKAKSTPEPAAKETR